MHFTYHSVPYTGTSPVTPCFTQFDHQQLQLNQMTTIYREVNKRCSERDKK